MTNQIVSSFFDTQFSWQYAYDLISEPVWNIACLDYENSNAHTNAYGV